MKRSITIIHPGLATSIQDQGRQGYYHLGIPPSGAMDQYSMQAANLLVGNQPNAAALECTLMAPTIRFNHDATVAITGAELTPSIDGEPRPSHCALSIKAGSTLSFGFMTLGARAYIAIDGGIDVPEVLGSRSYYALGGIGGLNGKALAANDDIPLGLPNGHMEKKDGLPQALRQKLEKDVTIRVIPGLYDHRLSEEGQTCFYHDPWKVASEADRIGYRFKGEQTLKFKAREQPFGAGADPSNIVDAPYPIGSIQVPAGKEPIILHRDAVSGGGYAMIATVISADMDLIGQMQPNYTAHFKAISLEDALAARAEYQARFKRLREYFA